MDEDDLLPADEHADLIGRLRSFGAAPVPPGVAARTFDRIRGNAGPRGRLLPVKVLVAATAGALVFGGVGLAAADVLPAPVQDVAHTTLDRVGVHVPPGHDRYNDPAVCPGGPYRNHGAYVRAHKSDPAAGKSPCGKPVQSVSPSGAKKSDDADGTGDDPGRHGPPPWAHNKNKSKGPHGHGDKNGTKEPDDKNPPSVAPKPQSTSTTTTSPATSTTTGPTSTTAPPSTTSTSSP